MAERRKPKKGYGFTEKQKYRKQVWDTFSELINPENSTVVILPSKNGKEIELAIQKGVKEENIIAIDDDEAMLAWAGWKIKYPKIKIYPTRLLNASEDLKSKGIKVHAANLDLCGNISQTTIEQVGGFVSNIIAYNKNPVIAITMFKGREKHAVSCLTKILVEVFEKQLEGISNRLGVMLLVIKKRNPTITNITQVANGEYPNGSNTMEWGIFKFTTEGEKHVTKKSNHYDW